jgi:hypothetical protein
MEVDDRDSEADSNDHSYDDSDSDDDGNRWGSVKKRRRQKTTVKIDGHTVKRVNNYDVKGMTYVHNPDYRDFPDTPESKFTYSDTNYKKSGQRRFSSRDKSASRAKVGIDDGGSSEGRLGRGQFSLSRTFFRTRFARPITNNLLLVATLPADHSTDRSR